MSHDYAQYTATICLATLGEPSNKRGSEYRYGNHGSLSIDTETGAWFDHEAQEGGGPLDLVMRETGRATVKAAISWLEEQGIKPEEKPEPKTQGKAARQTIQSAYDYVDENGQLVYQVCRMGPRKTFLQRRPKQDGSWEWKIKGTKALPYRLPDMLARPNATVLVVEGEKDADRIAGLGLVATCNSGGAGKWHDELTPYFKGRKVCILPDNDDAGRNHADLVAAKLKTAASSVRVVTLAGLPDKGDASDWIDEGGTKSQLVEQCKQAPEWEPVEEIKQAPDPEPKAQGLPFKPLGYNGNSYYYLPRGTEQVCEIRRGSHTSPSEMMSIAPLEWWEMAFSKEKGGVDWYAAANDLMRRCEEKGIYSQQRERGRGAWYDNGRAVLHLGNRLLVDGKETSIADLETRFIYTRQAPMEHGANSEPADDNEAIDVAELFDNLNWTKDVHGTLCLGWCVLAPICGALPWRPHIWLTAQRGAGKSWIQDHIIGPLLGPAALMVQGNTTEAGIRQKIKQDARPIVFDEAESEDHKSQARMQTVIELARQSSSDSTAEIIKGTVNGDGMAFRMRSMFMLGSVNVSLSQAADESRFSVLSLQTPEKTPEEIDRFEKFAKRVDNTLTDENCARIRARAYQLMPTIRANAKTFSRAVAEVLGSQRLGDQVGTLIAGSCAMYRSDEISLDKAREWVQGMDFEEAKETEQMSDEESCLARILQSQIRFDSERGVAMRSIGEVIGCAFGVDDIPGMTAADANDVLGRYGLKIDGQHLMVANKHAELEKLLRDTPWAAGWRRILSRIEGAEVHKSSVRFAGVVTRAVKVPVSFFR